MTQTIALPDGTQLQFPDGMSQPDMAAAIYKNFPAMQAMPANDAARSDAMRSGDLSAAATLGTQDAPDAQPKVGSIFDKPGIQMDAPSNDAAANLGALENARKNNPDIGQSPMYASGAALEQANAQAARGQVRINRMQAQDVAQNGQSSGSVLQDAAVNLLAGAPRQTAKALATGAQAVGADDAATSLDAAADYWREIQKRNGANTVVGRASDMVGSIIPVLLSSELLPAEAAYQTVANAGLFALPAFRDTLKEKLESGEQFPTALAHASQAFGINLFLPDIAAKGGALAKIATKQGGIVGGALATGAEGAGFSAANSMLDKGTDLAFGAAPNQQDQVAKKNVNDWVSLQDMAESALGFAAVKGAHAAAAVGADAAGRAASAAVDRFAPADYALGRALGQSVDHAEFVGSPEQAAAQARGFTPNPNLAGEPADRAPVVPPVTTPAAPSVDDVLSAGSLEDAAAAAEKLAGAPDAGAGIRDAMRAIRPMEDGDGAGADVSGLAAGGDRRGSADAGAGVGDRVGPDGSDAAVGREGVPAGAAGEAVPHGEPGGAVGPQVQAARDLVAAIDRNDSPLNRWKLQAVATNLGLEARPGELPQQLLERVRSAVGHPETGVPQAKLEESLRQAGDTNFGLKSVPDGPRPVNGDDAVPLAGKTLGVELTTRPYTEPERVSAQSDLAVLNRGLDRNNAAKAQSGESAEDAGPDEPARLLRGAPTPAMVLGRQVGRLLGVKTVFIEPHLGFSGVHMDGVAYVSPQERHPTLAIMGHEVLHGLLKTMEPQQAQALRDRLAPFLRPEAVAAKEKLEGRGSEHAREEVIADLNGSMWMDPQFWRMVREQDPHVFRELAYRFMEMAARIAQRLAKTSRFQAEKFTHDVEAVRRILAEETAMRAREEGVGKPSPTERAEVAGNPAFSRKEDGTRDLDADTISTRVPTSVGADPGHNRNGADVGIDVVKADPVLVKKHADLVRNDPIMGPARKGESDEQVIDRFVTTLKQNLLHLYDSVPEATRVRSRNWYMGANKIARDIAKEAGISERAASGVLAALSPQTPWDVNVSQAARVVHIWKNQQQTRTTPEMLKWLDDKIRTAQAGGVSPDVLRALAKAFQGKRLVDLPIEVQTWWVRAYDESHHSRGYDLVSPEGVSAGPMLKANGEPSAMPWGNTGNIEKAINILKDDSRANISANMGLAHKVRSFYNNIAHPMSTAGHTTIDTHAVAAARLEPLSGNAPEVGQAWGGKGSSSVAGQGGLYGEYAEAYRQAAAERGILPREMQSVTWEAARGLFPDTFKSKANNEAIRNSWSSYQRGEISLVQARSDIYARAGGVTPPNWSRPDVRPQAAEEAGPARDAGKPEAGGLRDRTAADGVERPDFSRTIEVAGERRPIEDSTGKPITPDHDSEKLKSFYRWFGSSRATDLDGHPLVVYHGSPDARFLDEDGIFATMKDRMLKFGNTPESRKAADDERGFFFTTSRGVAETYANPKRAFDYQNSEPAVIPTYLSVKNPLEFDATGLHWREAQKRISKDDFIKQAKDSGHDGVVIRNVRDSYDSLHTGRDPLSDVWVAFDSRQIKHAERNAGTFDPQNPDIRFDRATGEEPPVERRDVARNEPEPRELEPWKVAIAPRLDTALRRWTKGKGSDEDLAAAIRADLDARRQAREDAAGRDRVRGPDWVRERLLRARRTGEMNPAMVDMGLWLLDRNPQLATDLAISIRQGGNADMGVQGTYNPAARLVTLFTHAGNSDTAVHEILHHAERMMPQPVQDGIRKEWVQQLAREVERAKVELSRVPKTDPNAPRGWGAVDDGLTPEAKAERLKMLDAMLLSARNGDSDLAMMMYQGKSRGGIGPGLTGVVPYKVASPSEFWAVNGARILGDRAAAEGSWVARARQWLSELVERAKILLRLPSDAPVLRGLRAVLNGDGDRLPGATMISDQRGPLNSEVPDFARAADPDLPDDANEATEPVRLPGARLMERLEANPLYREPMLVAAPMSLGSTTAKAVAQQFANDMRAAEYQWTRMHQFLQKTFTPAQREAMWNAADEENVERTRVRDEPGYTRDPEAGLARLAPDERAAVEQMNGYSRALWRQAVDAGMVEGEGLPFWTPRMLVTVGETGEVGTLRAAAAGPKLPGEPVGRNLSTTSSNLKQRKHLTTDETEAAASALAREQGQAEAKVVRDILVMPMAMAKLERAIAGRQLVNQVKALGRASGEELVSDTGGPDYVTLPNPALTTWTPRFLQNAEGRWEPVLDQSGEAVFDAKPLYIRKDFEGPLRAVLSTRDGAWYTGYMLMKSKAMSAIMVSPFIHQMVIYGKALPYSPLKVGTGYLYVKGHAYMNDPEFMHGAIKDGMVPIGAGRTSLDVTELVDGGLKSMGRWGDMNESWVALSLQKLGNAIHAGWGDKAKGGIDAAGDFLHHTLLWKQIGALQAGIYADAKAHYLAKGFSPDGAGIQAARVANLYAGVVAKEHQGEWARKAANVMLFSRSFNFTNLAIVKDAFAGMPDGMKALIEQRAGKSEADRAAWAQRRKAWSVLALDVGFGLLLVSSVQSLVDNLKKDKTWGEIGQGYAERLAQMGQRIHNHPLTPQSYNPYQLSPTWANEPGKKFRISMGPDLAGREQYMRLPVGKVIEDVFGWLGATGETFWNKMAPVPKALWEAAVTGKDFSGTPVADPDGNTLKRFGQAMGHVIKAQLPVDTMKSLWDLQQGYATPLDKQKLAGQITGFTPSQGHPGGPEAAVASEAEKRFQATRAYTMQQVKDDLKRGDEDRARERMQEIGMSGREISGALRRLEDPRLGLTRQARQKFDRRANEQEREEMDLQRNR